MSEETRKAMEALANTPPETDIPPPYLCGCGRWLPCRHCEEDR